MTYKGENVRVVKPCMVDEYIRRRGYVLPPAHDVYEAVMKARYYRKSALEEAVDVFKKEYSRQRKKERRDERRRKEAEMRAAEMERFMAGAYHVYTDGSCDNIRTKVGGSGYVILKDGEVVKMKSKGFYPTTNNRMELLAIISAVNSIPEGSDVIVFTDSKYCIRVLDGYMHEKNHDLIRLFAKVSRPMRRIVFQWVKGHSGNEYNEMADELAFSAFKEMSDKLGFQVPKYMLKTH